jgi:polyhydroxybutyrate depolymerase
MRSHIFLLSKIGLFSAVIIGLLAACTTTDNLPGTKATIGIVAFSQQGCGKQPLVAPDRSANETIFSGGLQRRYRLHIPRGYHDTLPQALVMNFHGHGSNAMRQERLTEMSRLADRYDFIVVYPQGTIGLDHSTGWNTGPWNYPHVNDVLFVSDLLNHLESTLCVDPQRVYATGFSNGGSLTNVLACKLADRFAAFAIVSGGMHPVAGGCYPARSVSIMEFHGTNDHIVPYTGNLQNDDEPPITQWLTDWAIRDGCARTPVIFFHRDGILGERWPSCQDGAVIVHYRIRGEPHQWPTVDFTSIGGHVVSASILIWQFFQLHSLPVRD